MGRLLRINSAGNLIFRGPYIQTKKAIAKLGKILKYTGFSILRLLVILFFLVQTSWFQTWMAQQVASSLSEDLNTKVEIGSVDIEFFNTLVLNDIYIEDLQGDTLLYAPQVDAEIEDWSISQHFIKVEEVDLIEPRVKLQTYEGEEQLNFQFIVDHFASDEEDTDTTKSKWDISCDAITLWDAHMSIKDHNNKVAPEYGMNFADLDLKKLGFTISDFAMDGDTIRSRFDQLGFIEKSGFALDTLNANLKVSPAGIGFTDALIKTPNSTIQGELGVETESYADYADFFSSVRQRSEFKNTTIQLADLAYFVPTLEGIDKTILIRKGKVRGFMSALKGKSFDLQIDKRTQFVGSFDMTGLPNINETFISLSIKNFETNKRDLERIPLPPFKEGNTLSIPDDLASLGQIKIKGNFDGFVNDFVAESVIRSDVGSVRTNISLKYDTAIADYRYDGLVSTTGLDIGLLAKQDELGIISSHLQLKGSGFTEKSMRATLAGEIDEFDFHGYRYQHIAVNGDINRANFKGSFDIDDRNLALDFDGVIDFNGRMPKMNFVADLQHMYLAKLNLIEGDTSQVLNTHVVIDLVGNSADNIEGELRAEQTFFVKEGQLYNFNNVIIKSAPNAFGKKLTMQSDFLDFDLWGDFNFEHLGTSGLSIAASVVPSVFGNEVYIPVENQIFDYQVIFKDFSPVTRLFMPEMEISEYSTITGTYNCFDNDFNINIEGERLKFGDQVYRDFFVDCENLFEVLLINVGVGELDVTDSLIFNDVQLRSYVYQDMMPVNLTWSNVDSTIWGRINGNAYVESLSNYEFDFRKSHMHYRDLDWDISNSGKVKIHGDTIDIETFEAFYYDQMVGLNGSISRDSSEKLEAEFLNFDLTNLNPFIQSSGFQLYGLVNGGGYVADLYNNVHFESDALIELLGINSEMIGDMKVQTAYEPDQQRIKLNGNLVKSGLETIGFEGFYYTQRKDDNFDLAAKLKGTNLGIVNAFMPDGAGELAGKVNGHINLSGSTNAPQMEGSLDFVNSSILVGYTNVKYMFNGRVGIYPDMITMDYLPLRDTRGGRGSITGTLLHDNFSDMNFDVFVDMNKMMCLNTTEQMNELYYGTAFGTGNVTVFGYQDNLKIDANIKTEKGTKLDLPLSGSTEVTASDFVTFIDTAGTLIEEQIDLTGIDMTFKIEATEDASMRVIFDEAVGDIMEGTGYGNIVMKITPAGDLEMVGKYNVTEGGYLFTLQNIISKQFNVEGGTIEWTGDPYKGVLDLETRYEVRTTLYDLLHEENDAYKKRIPVYVVMDITGGMLDPDIAFDIDLPTIDQNTQAAVSSVIATEQDRNKQAFALILLNKFLPAEGGGPSDGGGGGVASSSSSELLSNQLTNWVNKLSNKLDLGVNYRPGDDVTGDELAIAATTAIFNDRITISTNVGVSGSGENNSGSNSSALIGDFAIEYKITEDGRLKMRAFNESNDGNLEGSQAPYTQGVGIYYKEEFDSTEQIYYWQAVLNPFRSKDNEKKQRFIAKKQERKDEKKRRKEAREKEKAELRKRYEQILQEAEDKKAKDADPDGTD